MAEISNDTYAQLIRGTDDADDIGNNHVRVTINAGGSNDNIWNGGTYWEDNGIFLYARFANYSSINDGAGDDTISNQGSESTVLGGDGNDSIVNFVASTTDNFVFQKYAGSNVLIGGGAGNDTLYGGSGNDTFIYRANESTDRIMDYASGDMLKILKSNGKAGRFTSSTFSGGTLTLGISGGGSVIFENVKTSTIFNINNRSYKISGSRLVRK